ncbi:MAG: hypothetical protein HUU50_18115 [Candidatus Brocadiae bacterium]|nr:hypothetical protein [Candidatus Brocadiia bacterium]
MNANILGSIVIPDNITCGEQQLEDGTIVEWKIISRGLKQRNLSEMKEEKLNELRRKVHTPFLPVNFKPLSREEANERKE